MRSSRLYIPITIVTFQASLMDPLGICMREQIVYGDIFVNGTFITPETLSKRALFAIKLPKNFVN